KGQVGGVKEVTSELELGGEARNEVRRAIEGVADNGVAEGLSMDADLVSAAGFDADFDKGEGAIRSNETFEDVEVRDGGAYGWIGHGAAGRHAGAADEVTGDG